MVYIYTSYYLPNRRHTGAFTPKNMTANQRLTSADGYRLRDTSDRIVREKQASSKTRSPRRAKKGRPLPKKRTVEANASKPSGKQIGPPINHNGKYYTISEN